MSRQRFILLLIAALVAISAAFYLSSKRNPPPVAQGAALLPALSGDIAAVTAVSVKKGSASPVTVHKSGDQWTVAERADYPADVAKLRKLLLALRDAKIVETKTANPASFGVIGVEDPAQPGASSSEVTVTAPSGALAVIVGKSIGEGNFVRRAGENQSYSVEPAISFETEPRYWIDTKLFNLPKAQIQSEQVKPSEGPAYTVHRAAAPVAAPAATPAPASAAAAGAAPAAAAPADVPFVLDGVPAGRKALDAPALAPSASALSDLAAEDVAQVSDVDFKQPAQAIVTLTDGTVITLTGVVIADKHWIQIASTKDAVLSAKPEGRVFQVASYRYDAIFKPLEQLLVAKEPPAAKATPAKATPGAVTSGAPRKGPPLPSSSPARKGPASSPTP
jgi:hypothetical protein